MDYSLQPDSGDDPTRKVKVLFGDLSSGIYQAVLAPTPSDRIEIRAVPREDGYAYDVALIIDGGYGTIGDAKRLAATWRKRVVVVDVLDPGQEDEDDPPLVIHMLHPSRRGGGD